MNSPDYSKERDLIAKDIATERTDDAGVRFDALELMVHGMKGELSANTAFTREVLGSLDEVKAKIALINVEKITELVNAVDSMRGGVRVLGWLERPAKWLASMLALAGAIWATWHSNGGGK